MDLKKFKHFISLGGNCYVVEDLIRLGLRDYAYPFDWCFSTDFSGVISAIENEFSGFVEEEFLLQHKDSRARYYNEKYKFSFFHDFNKYLSLRKQIDDVRNKYNRRINRFLNDVCEPTLFIRYIITRNDIEYLRENYYEIEKVIKLKCPENEIIYITHYEELLPLSDKFYLIRKDEGDWISHTPLMKVQDFVDAVENSNYEKRNENLSFDGSKLIKKKKFSTEKCLRRLFKKEYIHNRVYQQK